MVNIVKEVSPSFEDYIFDWDYETYLTIGGYGSSKSYSISFKIILKLLQEKRKALVVREVYDTITDSCYDLFCEILKDMNLYTEDKRIFKRTLTKVLALKSPMQFRFPNGSTIIFKGMDKPSKIKSINGVSIVWLEEASEIKYDGYKELLGRIRTPDVSMHFILSCNPVSRSNWVYRHFFVRLDKNGKEQVLVDEKQLYDSKTLIKNGIYFHHSTPDDNPWLPYNYIKRLDELRHYDYPLYTVARLGQFGATGIRVLPQLSIAKDIDGFERSIERLGIENQYFGMDFGFETSYNAVVSMSVDQTNQYLYIWDEIYMNKITDDEFALVPEMLSLKELLNEYYQSGHNKLIVADDEDPKAIAYYRKQGFRIRSTRAKFRGSRLSNTRKVKRFKKIIVHPNCINTARELKELTYKKDSKGDTIFDQFNIDPHTFSAIWYGLDLVEVVDLKRKTYNSKAGQEEKNEHYF